MNVVTVKHSLEKTLISLDLIERIIKKLEKLVNLKELRLSVELTSYVCNIVANEVNEQFTKEEKESLIISIIEKLYVCGPEDLSVIKSQITYLSDNKKIKKISVWKYCKFFLKSFLPKL
jgi:hypothetical protein